MPAAVIVRLLVDPFKTEWLSLDGAKPEWSASRLEAVLFASHHEADRRAEALRQLFGRGIFAAVATKPMPVAFRHRPETETEGFAPVRELPAKKKRRRRAEREREEMEARDLLELEEKAING
jgi:hypothetical protein